MIIWLPTYKEWCLSLTAAVSACDFNSYSCNLSWVTSFICFPDHDCFFVGAAAWKLNPCCFGLERTRNNNSILFCLSTVVAAHNFNRFSCDSSWAEQLFHCITNLESLSIHVQWTRFHAHLVANGQEMWDPMLFLVRAVVACAQFQLLFLWFIMGATVSLHNQPRISLYPCTMDPSPYLFGCQWTRNDQTRCFSLSVTVTVRPISTSFHAVRHESNLSHCITNPERFFWSIYILQSQNNNPPADSCWNIMLEGVSQQWLGITGYFQLRQATVWSIVQGLYVLKQSEFDWYCQSYDFSLLQQQHNSSCL